MAFDLALHDFAEPGKAEGTVVLRVTWDQTHVHGQQAVTLGPRPNRRHPSSTLPGHVYDGEAEIDSIVADVTHCLDSFCLGDIRVATFHVEVIINKTPPVWEYRERRKLAKVADDSLRVVNVEVFAAFEST